MAEQNENKELKQVEETSNTVDTNKAKKEKKEKKALTVSERKARHGVLSTSLVVIVIAIVIAINIFVSGKEWNYDFTAQKLYTLSNATEKVVKDLDKKQKIQIYFLDKESNVNTIYKNVLSQYTKLNKNITVEYKDLDVYPNFASKYLSEGTSAGVGDSVVVCGDRFRYIKSSDYITGTYDESGNYISQINVEPRITAAINYVVSEDTPVIYSLTGQGEQSISETLKSNLEQDNYTVSDLDIVTKGGIPKDCSILMINAPNNDLSDTVITLIDEYMADNGRLFVVLDPNTMYPKINALLAKYGVKVEEGLVLDQGSGYFMGNTPAYLLPTLASHDITTPISQAGLKVLAPVAKGLTKIKDVTDYTVTDLLITSDQSYSKVDMDSNDISKTEDDVEGPLAIAQVVDNKDGEGVVFVSGSSAMMADEINQYVSNANINLYNNAVNYLSNQDNKISVKSSTYSVPYAVFSAFATKMVLAIGVIGIPLFLLILGVIVIIVRRNN